MSTKANEFFQVRPATPALAQALHPNKPKPPRFVTERQQVYQQNAPWYSCDLYALNSPEYHGHMKLVQQSPLPAYRKCRFRVRRLSDSKVVLTGQHVSLS